MRWARRWRSCAPAAQRSPQRWIYQSCMQQRTGARQREATRKHDETASLCPDDDELEIIGRGASRHTEVERGTAVRRDAHAEVRGTTRNESNARAPIHRQGLDDQRIGGVAEQGGIDAPPVPASLLVLR